MAFSLKATCATLIIALVFFLYGTASELDSADVQKKVGFAIYPALSYTPETSLMFGGVAFLVFKPAERSEETYRPTSISPYLVYSLNNQLEANIDFDIFLKNGVNLALSTRYMNFPDYYYGIGPNTDINDEELFANRTFYLEGQALKSFTDRIFAGLTFDFRYDQLTDFAENSALLNSAIPGVDGGFIFGIGPAFRFDTRDNILFPGKGSLINIEALFYPDVPFNDYSFSRFTFDFRKYLSLNGNPDNIIALQFLTKISGGDAVPFYKLPRLGGSKRLRGIGHANRYIDRHVMYAQAEYRRKLFWRFSGVAFTGVGDVAERIGGFDPGGLKVVAGLGGRFQALKDEKLNARIDLGFTIGKGQNGLYFLIREAF